MGYAVLVILIGLFTWFFWRNSLQIDLPKKDILLGWGIKVVISVIFMLVFTEVYTNSSKPHGDVGNFYEDSRIMAEYGKEDPVGYLKLLFGIDANNLEVMQTHLAETNIWSYGENGDFINDNRLILRINSVIHFVSFGVIWVHVLVFAFISFFSSLLIFKSFCESTYYKRYFYFALLLTPTLTFWGGGLTKETLFLFGFALFVYTFRKFGNSNNIKAAALLLISFLILLFNKTHLGIVLIPLSTYLLIGYRKGYTKRTSLLYSGMVVLLFVISALAPTEKVNIVDRISVKQTDMTNLGKGGVYFVTDSSFCAFDYDYINNFEYHEEESKIKVLSATAGEYKLFGQDDFYPFEIQASEKEYDTYLVFAPSNSYISVPLIDGSFIQLIKNTPLAVVNVMLRPFPTDPGSSFKYVVFSENLLFIAFLIFSIIRRRRIDSREKLWVFYFVLSATCLVFIIGWTIPVLGAIVRYKMAVQLLLILAMFLLIGPKKLTAE